MAKTPVKPMKTTAFMDFWRALNKQLASMSLPEVTYGPARHFWHQLVHAAADTVVSKMAEDACKEQSDGDLNSKIEDFGGGNVH